MSAISTLHYARTAIMIKLQVRNTAFFADLAISTFTNRKRWLIVKLQSMFFVHILGQFQKDFNYIARY